MVAELDHQPKSHESAGEVRRQPTWIVHYLKNGHLTREPVVFRIEAGLVIRFAVVAKRTIHVDPHLAVFAGLGPLNADDAGKILRNIRALITLVSEGEQLQIKRLVITFEAHRQIVSLALVL